MPRKLAPGTLVLIDWTDAACDVGGGWADVDSVRDVAAEPYRCRTVGWVLSDDGVQLLVASTVHPNEREPDKVQGTFHLPHRFIDRLTILRKP